MIQDLVKPYMDSLADLEYITRLGGVITVISKKFNTKDGIVVKKFPAFKNPEKTTCTPDDYVDMIPNSKEIGTVYFEDLGTRVTKKSRRYVELQSRFRLVGHFNLKKLAQEDTLKIVANILQVMPKNPSSTENIWNIRYSFDNEQPKSESIFRAYSYDEAETQYLIYPFGYFALDIVVDWWLPWGCIELLTIPVDMSCT